jgi:hypothetical protein
MFDFPKIKNTTQIKIGDYVKVGSQTIKAKIEKIWWDEKTAREVIDLCWGEFGKSKVYMNDLNKVWFHINSNN